MNALQLLRCFLFGSVALSFPIAAFLVFQIGWDRQWTADVLSCIYGFGLLSAMFASFLPLSCLSKWTRFQRVESLVLSFLGMSYFTHVSWELGWLLLGHRWIRENQNSPWAYPWWAYIDGGDARYAHPDGNLLGMEILSVCNGCVGVFSMQRFLFSSYSSHHEHQQQTPKQKLENSKIRIQSVLMMTGTAVVHLYSALLYYWSEILSGLPNVNTESFIALYIKFGLANAPWVIVPWFVFWWCATTIIGKR